MSRRYYVLARGQLPRWIAAESAETKLEALAKVDALKSQDAAFWIGAEFRVDTSKHVSDDAGANA